MIDVTDAPPFSIAAELPGPGVTVIEASAGTGKTYTLTSLVARFVADGVPLSEVLAVTFTRAATGELRDRIRQRLLDVHAALADERSGGRSGVDELAATLGVGSTEEVESRWIRLGDALADFDAATIATTHGFCQLVLSSLGTAGDIDTDISLLEDPTDLVDEVVDDLYLRHTLLHGRPPPFKPGEARAAARLAVRNADARLVPAGGADPAGLLSRLAGVTRTEVHRRLMLGGHLTYDHLLERLAQTLDDPDRGPVARRRLQGRFSVVLVDEFQDTDPVQWTILRKAFGGGQTRLVLIGDPKQAIYAFRGADVHAYLQAASEATGLFTLTHQWRADQPLLDALGALFAPTQFGHEHIPFRAVEASPDHQEAGVDGLPVPAPLRFRVVDDRQPGVQLTLKQGLLQKGSLIDWIAADVAADIGRVLAARPVSRRPGDGRAPVLAARDIAVLTRTNRQAIAVRDALRAAGVPSVVGGLDSVFRSPAARDWRRLLEALQEPASRSKVAAAALTPLMGLSVSEAATASERRWEEIHDRIHRWAAVLHQSGVATLYRHMVMEAELPGRLLSVQKGERRLTDLGHIAHLLHAEATAGQLGGSSLLAWLAARIKAAGDEQEEVDDRSRRLDSDAEAVQVLTVHGAKGLEFSIVYCPYLWDGGIAEKLGGPIVFYDPDRVGARLLDVGQTGPPTGSAATPSYSSHAALARQEGQGEELRLLYVALTRARHQVVVHYGRASRSRFSPLARMLLCRDAASGAIGEPRGSDPGAGLIRPALEEIAARAPSLVSVERAGAPPAGSSPALDTRDPGPLRRADFTRVMDLRWKRSSYTSITAAAHGWTFEGEAVGSEPESPGSTDEPGGQERPTAGSSIPAGFADRASPFTSVPGGADVGTFVHDLLARVDFAGPDRLAQLRRAGAATPGWAVPVADTEVLYRALDAALDTPLGSIAGDGSLSSVGRRDRLDELGFEMPVAGGDIPVGDVVVAQMADLLQAHLDRSGTHVLDGYPARLRDPLLQPALRGYLTGSLDLVFRRPDAAGPTRWYLADYKTNWLGGEDLTAWDYRPAALDAEMQRRHYPLQALIYMVALHRYLRWRQSDYQPGRHLGGVLYLFLRGMVGPGTPAVDGEPCGVWSWAVPPDLVVELSDLLDTGRAGSER